MATILIIDDSASMIAFMEQTLGHAGHTVTAAKNGKEGLAQMRGNAFDLVITDLYMPELDGIETIIQARKAGPLPRLIAISSKDSIINLLPAAKMLGALKTLRKPFTAEQLLETVDAVLRLPTPPVSPLAQPRSAQPARAN